MISVIIQCHNQEAELAKTLSALVSGAVEGVISDVTVLDNGSIDGTATVADAAGCHFHPISELPQVIKDVRSQWVLLMEPGAKPLMGWVESLGEHVAIGNSSAKFSPSVQYRLPFLKRVMRHSLPLEYGLLMPKQHANEKAQSASALDQLARGVKARKLKGQLVPASYAKYG